MAASVLLAKKFDDNMDPTGWWMSEKLVNSINLTINGLLMLMLNEINICYVYVYIYFLGWSSCILEWKFILFSPWEQVHGSRFFYQRFTENSSRWRVVVVTPTPITSACNL